MIKTKSPARHHHGDLKGALLEYALQAAQAGALDDLSLRKASRDLGVSPGAAYRHFKDKDALMRTVAQRGFDTLAARFEAAMPFDSTAKTSSDARQRFVALATEYVRFSQDNYGLWRLMFGPFGVAPDGQADRPSTYDWLAKSLSELAAFGLTAPPDASSQFFAWTAIHGLSDLASSPAVPHREIGVTVESQCAHILGALASARD